MILLLALACAQENELNEQSVSPSPVVALTSPLAASWWSEDTIDVTGRWENVDTVTVNALPATLAEDGTFHTPLPLGRGLNLIEALGVSSEDSTFDRIAVLAGPWMDPAQPIDEGLLLRLNDSGLDLATDYAAGLVNPETLNESVTAQNPVYEDSYGLWGWDAVEISGDIEEITFSKVQIEATPSSGLMALEVTIPDLYVDLQAYGEIIGIDFDTDASLSSTKAVITGDLLLDVDGAGGLAVALSGPQVDLKGFSYDTSLLPWDIEDHLFVDSVRDAVEGLLIEKIEELVPPLLEDLLTGLDLSFELDLMGAPLTITAEFTRAAIDRDGVALSTLVNASAPPVGDKVYSGFLGSRSTTPDLDTRSPVSGAISDDLVNRILFEAWRAGVLDMFLSTADGSLQPLLLLPLKAEEGSIQLTANLPPVAIEVDGGLQLQVGEIQVDILTPGGELGEFLQVSVAALIDLELVVAEGVVTLEIGTPALTMMVQDSDWGASEQTTTRLIEEMLPLESFMMLLSSLEFPLPGLEGLTIESARVARDLGTGLHTSLEIEIEL